MELLRMDLPEKIHSDLLHLAGPFVIFCSTCQAVAEALSENNTIKELYIFGNQPGAEAR